MQWRLKQDPEAFEAWLRAPSLPAQPTLFMVQVLRGILPIERARDMLDCGLPVSKLTWKEDINEADFDAICASLDTN